ncbi:AraC family transcriptional regulator [Paenibacillus sp. HB172176]|uniref:AraC family transcriptional regulator n=1 Tax=Paenibacillus sp. HB172176 TaxID=2493690 RepID=UPI001439A716|nr:AraC family transcriptional regulator [Paenibacillus sp. HB172176]
MEIFKEPIYHQNEQLRLKVWKFNHRGKEDSKHKRWHYHKEVECLLILEGVHEISLPSRTYFLHPGEVLLIGSNQLHRPMEREGQPVEYIVLHVDLEPYFDSATMHYMNAFMERLHPLDELNRILHDNLDARREIGDAVLRIHQEIMEQRKGYELAVSMSMKQFLLALYRYDSEGIISSYGEKEMGVLSGVFHYIEEHLGERLDMAEISEMAGMSYVYFSKYFKLKTGYSFTEFVNRKRMDRAKRRLAITDRNISDIAISVGFENMAHFYELFKRFNGCTPRQYREKMTNTVI